MFNIKGIDQDGRIVMGNDTEQDESGNLYYEYSNFKASNNVDESFEDYCNLINNRYISYLQGDTLDDWVDALEAGRYSTDPNFKRYEERNAVLGVIINEQVKSTQFNNFITIVFIWL